MALTTAEVLYDEGSSVPVDAYQVAQGTDTGIPRVNNGLNGVDNPIYNKVSRSGYYCLLTWQSFPKQ